MWPPGVNQEALVLYRMVNPKYYNSQCHFEYYEPVFIFSGIFCNTGLLTDFGNIEIFFKLQNTLPLLLLMAPRYLPEPMRAISSNPFTFLQITEKFPTFIKKGFLFRQMGDISKKGRRKQRFVLSRIGKVTKKEYHLIRNRSWWAALRPVSKLSQQSSNRNFPNRDFCKTFANFDIERNTVMRQFCSSKQYYPTDLVRSV